MSLTKSQITGHLNTATQIRFALSRWDSEGPEIVLDQSQTFDLIDGAIPETCRIWPNLAGLRGTSYTVYSGLRGADGYSVETEIGTIQVPEGESHVLADLLLASASIVPGNSYTVVNEEEFLFLKTAVLATGDDRARAETAAEQTALDAASTALNAAAAEESASRVDLGALDAAVAQTGEDRTAASIWAATAASYAGTAQLSATRALDVVDDITAQATIAATQAGIATTQAGIATEAVAVIAPVTDDIALLADNIEGVQDAAAGFPAIQSAMLSMATAFTNAQSRFIAAHAFA